MDFVPGPGSYATLQLSDTPHRVEEPGPRERPRLEINQIVKMPVVNLLATLTQHGPDAVITALPLFLFYQKNLNTSDLNVPLQHETEIVIHLMLKLSLNETYWKTLFVFSHIFLKPDSSLILFVPKQQQPANTLQAGTVLK